MGDRFLQPRQNLGYTTDALFRQVAVHLVAQLHVNAAVSQNQPICTLISLS
jgi:hypothetical protein